MKLSVIKDNEHLFQVDFAKEIDGNDGKNLTFFVGRSESCQVVLDDKMVSREHAKINFSSGLWSIDKASDFNTISLNGTFCDHAPLKNGDLINIGPFTLNVNLPMDTIVSSSETIEEDLSNDEMDPSLSGINVGLGVDEATELLDQSEIENELVDIDEPLDDDLNQELDGDLDEGFSSDLDEPLNDDLDDDLGGDDAVADGLESSGEQDFKQDDFSNDSAEDGQDEFSDEFSDVGFSDDVDGFAVDEFEDDIGEKTQVLKSFAVFNLEVFGEYAPYDKFLIEKPETFIGRDPEKCEILLNDPEVSGVHAVIKKNAITCTLEDLKSANGTILNGERVNSHELTNEDEFLIGSTTFTVKIQSDFIEQEKDRIMPVEENQVVEVEEVVEVDENFDDLGTGIIDGDGFGQKIDNKPKSLFSKESLKDPQQRKKILYGLVGLLVLWVVLDEDTSKDKKPAPGVKKAVVKAPETPRKNQKILTPEEKELAESQYLLANQLFLENKYDQALMEIDKVLAIDPNYKNAKQIKALAKEGLERITKILEEERQEKERKLRALKVKSLLEKAAVAVKDRKVKLSKGLFDEILALDPENFEVTQLKIEIDAYEKEQERIAIEKAQKEAERKRQLQDLEPGKTFYNAKEWYKASLKLQDYLRKTGIDKDLVDEANKMLKVSQSKLNGMVNPLIGKARSMKEGQDLKGAYELYMEVLNYHPAHEEALNEMDEIRNKLELRSKRVYREAIIAESLSLYDNAKEKFQEVQQISPTDSDYYKKATEKLKDYLD